MKQSLLERRGLCIIGYLWYNLADFQKEISAKLAWFKNIFLEVGTLKNKLKKVRKDE
jgi:hypothetical protein